MERVGGCHREPEPMTAPRTRRLTTERLVLRQPTEGDLPVYVIVTNGEDAAREHKDAVAHWRAHGFGPWLVELDGKPVGVVEVHYAGPGVVGIEPHEVEVGWVTIEGDRSQGIATEAARAALEDAWEHAMPNHHGWIVAYIRPENTASIRVAEKLGLRHEADGVTRSGHPALLYRAWPK
jgi:RimJ/RimL family protein N-acetyltransferase